MVSYITFRPIDYIKKTQKKTKYKINVKNNRIVDLQTDLKKLFPDKDIKEIKEIKKSTEKYVFRNKENGRIDESNKKDLAENYINNLLVYNEVEKLKKEYKGNKFVWLPSTAKNPRHEHMAYYGNVYSLEKGADGKGLLPGQLYNCQCGMRILNNDNEEE